MSDSIPSTTGVNVFNVLTAEQLAVITGKVGSGKVSSPNSSSVNGASLVSAVSWLKADRESGNFIAVPARMMGLKSAGLTLNELLLLAFIFGFQRKEIGATCSVPRSSLDEILGVPSVNTLSPRFTKLAKEGLLASEGLGSARSYFVNERAWAVAVRALIDPDNLSDLHKWTRGGEFSRIPRWISSSRKLSAVDKMLFGLIYSYSTMNEAAVYSKSLGNTALELCVSKSSVQNSYERLTGAKLIKKHERKKTEPPEYTVDAIGCRQYALKK